MQKLVTAVSLFFSLSLGAFAAPFQMAQEHRNFPKVNEAERENRSQLTDNKHYRVIYTPLPDPIPLNQHFRLKLTVQDAQNKVVENAKIYVDADMPTHNHGMTVKPKVKDLGKGIFEVRGMLFHMPGFWEIYVLVDHAGKKEKAVFGVTVKMSAQD
ncbi:hypothetical protein COW36_04060 [bacterium (Candidatus Blackallbacteria) CG17_big_fil_post_rev_8_21_14_2_50_48_46]|uniref:YtkA-like domain-containing protein n=1 Tax=bacterium (Candidatus Blackallbacteria) CG17_big_fil_post_rev_8_21_14_2_50_48_46 TaxID=2014261 RepID=A0A2M7G8Q3_9BACT|nr:MAG: hypothetical protein COW64_04885 [bacterium (Candidatus Blackallbacteria) CG18_big_fil_WC_8_21_14_2_50_49_26]PIW18473.1 MAG: hypothetical protein COW36_04060 [bacterium (Candidatus Blackallbacteria) CG17_big_fil_post_rev_8_21_14_2_50_48_46]PIW46542.1 MAG: hypothetical protein COW20_16620 [bacterium (Candidatus Blackallbacteria) CG13_big_fil_rev_8_21_14_2_50_49_14]